MRPAVVIIRESHAALGATFHLLVPFPILFALFSLVPFRFSLSEPPHPGLWLGLSQVKPDSLNEG